MDWLKQNNNKPQKKLNGINKQQAFRNKVEKIILMGDSHIKGYAPELKSRLGSKFEVMHMVMPGARLHNITELFSQMNLLTRKDTIILRGGSNDIAKNEAVSGLRSLGKFVNSENTNIIFITAPHRYDLMESSCVNEEIQIFNRKMHTIIKLENNVKILDTINDRSLDNLNTHQKDHLLYNSKHLFKNPCHSRQGTRPGNMEYMLHKNKKKTIHHTGIDN
jgi:hypothetical protein